jgi:hypothetical protein
MADLAAFWHVVGMEPQEGWCCPDAYASTMQPLAGHHRAEDGTVLMLHTGPCPRRCNELQAISLRLQLAEGAPAVYPCALTVRHEGQCWIHPTWRS